MAGGLLALLSLIAYREVQSRACNLGHICWFGGRRGLGPTSLGSQGLVGADVWLQSGGE